ncbi:MAG: ribonuclease R, partial [Hyphomicrobiaceae bacterium]
MAKTPRPARRGGLPTKDEIVEYLTGAPEKTGKRELARAFGLKGGDRIALKRLLAEMTEEGTLIGNRKRLKEKGALAATAVILVTGTDSGGDLIGRPATWNEDGPPPRVRIREGRGRRGEALTLAAGDRVLARLEKLTAEDEAGIAYLALPIRKLAKERHRLLGIFRSNARGGGTIEPIDRRDLKEWPVDPHDTAGAGDGDLVRFEISTPHHHSRARIDEIVGNPADQRQISLIAVHAHGLPEEFSKAALEEADELEPIVATGRADLRNLALVT